MTVHVPHAALTSVEIFAWYGSIIVFELGQPLQVVSKDNVIINLHGRYSLTWRVRLRVAWHHGAMLVVRGRHRRWPHLPLALLNNFFNSLNIVLGGTHHELLEQSGIQVTFVK